MSGPTTGMRSTNAGGCGIVTPCSDFAHAPTSPEYSASVLMATQNGNTNTSSIAIVITTMASIRLPPSQRCSDNH